MPTTRQVVPAARWTEAAVWWAAGVPSHEIAARLGCAPATVRQHAHRAGWGRSPARRGPTLDAPRPRDPDTVRVPNCRTTLVVEPVTVRCHVCGRHRQMTLASPIACACGADGARRAAA